MRLRKKSYLLHLSSSEDLVTTYEAIRAGFIALALEKNRRATPYVEQARALKLAASTARTPHDLLKIDGIQSAILTAAGISDKAANHLLPEDKNEAVQGLISNFLEPAGSHFVEELVFRFLLTKGDTLGGSMRNVGGALAQRKLTRGVIANLTLAKKKYRWLHSETKTWATASEEDADIELFLRGLTWQSTRGVRTLLHNVTVPMVKNNVDLILLNCEPEGYSRELLRDPSAYVALGELKGGIDPAGADEHWKTALSALVRIHRAFSAHQKRLNTFFIGAAIEKRMAEELWNYLQDGTITNAANLTDDDQIASIAGWLCDL